MEKKTFEKSISKSWGQGDTPWQDGVFSLLINQFARVWKGNNYR